MQFEVYKFPRASDGIDVSGHATEAEARAEAIRVTTGGYLSSYGGATVWEHSNGSRVLAIYDATRSMDEARTDPPTLRVREPETNSRL